MKRTLLLCLIIFISLNLLAQKNKTNELGFILYDANGNTVKDIDKASTYEEIIETNDTTYIARNYHKNGPMIWQQTFKDENLSIANGRFVWYNDNGNIDSTGIAVNGHKDGVWQFYAHLPNEDKNKLTNERDTLVKTEYYNLGKKISKEEYFHDTSGNSAIKRSFFKVGKPITELEFNNDTTGRRPAEFPNGIDGWRKYLVKNLNNQLGSLIPQYENINGDRAMVAISFLVGKDGTVDDVYILHSSGYPFDRESSRIIENSGKWIPANYDGRKVTYRQTQRVIFAKGY